MGRSRLRGLGLLVALVALASLSFGQVALASPSPAACQPMGWFPEDIGLKDHTVFWHDGYYYLASIHLHPDQFEDRLAYARSTDLCQWEALPPILTERTEGAWDEFKVWAPFVLEKAGLYYMYFTGVTDEVTQSILLATTADPSDSGSWQVQSMLFQPDHAGSVWQAGAWADCRDPMVVEIDGVYHLYYSATDELGGIVGLAIASAPDGPWSDQGAVLTLPGTIPESPTVVERDGLYYLFYTVPFDAGYYRVGNSPAGPWSEARRVNRGWAHEIWSGQDGYTYASFLTTYSVTISRLTWDTFYDPVQPFIGESVHHLLLPLVGR